MKGLKKIALATAITAVAAGAQAELKALDDSTMGELTGQAGLTIDLETEWTIGEFAYQDAGFIVLRDLSMGGNSNEGTNTMLDNIRMEIDVAGADQTIGGDANLKYGFSNVSNLAAVHVGALAKAGVAVGSMDQDMVAAASGSQALIGGALEPLWTAAGGDLATNTEATSTDGVGGAAIDSKRMYNDGDLKIHLTFTDAWQKAGGFAAVFGPTGGSYDGQAVGADVAYSLAKEIATKAVDFEFNIGQIGLASSQYDIGNANGIERTDQATGLDGDDTTTTLISDLSMKGYLGPADIYIQNNGNGFGKDGSYLGANLVAAGYAAANPGATAADIAAAVAASNNGTGNADSKIQWDSFFRITDLDVYIDIAGVQITDLAIHNDRGDTTSLNGTAAFGFAHSMREIYAVKDTVLNIGSTAAAGSTNRDNFVDGIAINTRFKGDIDIGALSFGDTGDSIGSIYLTDITSTTNWTISAR